MRRTLFIPLSALVLWGCGGDGPGNSSVASSVTVTPGSITLDAVGATRVVHATVRDQGGGAITNPSLSWSSSSSAVTVAGAGGDSAIVTAAANGNATVTASAGTASGSANVQVAQAAAGLQKTAGDLQTGTVGTALPTPLKVTVVDRLGAPVAGQPVTFAVTGGGSLSVTTATTGADGSATTTWTLGMSTATAQAVTATSGASSVSFGVTAVSGPAAAISISSGNGQTGATGAALPLAPVVRVVDAFGNPVSGASVTFAVTGGGGSVAGSPGTTGPDGLAAPGSWTLGAASGTNTLQATVTGTGLTVTFTAQGVPSVPGSVAANGGNQQAAMAGTAVPTAPSVIVKDPGGTPIAGITVTFAVTSGGGTLTGATATTNAAGVATLGSWTLGNSGPNQLTATVAGAGLTGNPVIFTGVGCTGGGGGGYAITLCPTTTMTVAQRAAFDGAAARWGGLITGDLANITPSVAAGTCGTNSPALNFNVDDLVIFAAVENIDGPGSILGSAGWCIRRAAGLPIVGTMRFDAADMANLESGGHLGEVITHEMGHVVGIGSLWNTFGLLQEPSQGIPQDTWYSGVNGLTGFNNIGGASYTGGNKVPVENTGGGGTANVHWREAVLGTELMTGFLNGGGANPLSELTVRSLIDLGYTVNVAGADPFSVSLSLRGNAVPGSIKLENDVWVGARYTIDRAGRVTRIR